VSRPLLDLRDLRVDFAGDRGPVRVVDGVSLRLAAGECLALVGESGSGKTVTALSLARLLTFPPAVRLEGEIWLAGQDVLRLSDVELRRVRGGIVSYVFQDPGAALNPVQSIGNQILEMLRLHQPRLATRAEVVRLLHQVGIPAAAERVDEIPFRLSGGMQQRAMLAMALASRPQLLVADEPTSALDVTVQAQLIELLRDLKQRTGMGLLLITHNLGVVADVADRVAVMYAGEIVETGPAPNILHHPRHPYTRALIASVPVLGATGDRLAAIPGTVPVPGEVAMGCRFAPRCPYIRLECRETHPVLAEAGPAQVRCPWLEVIP